MPFLSAGFILKEDTIKLQHKMMSTREKWRGHKYDFYKIAREHLYILRKPARDEKTSPLKFSKKWWQAHWTSLGNKNPMPCS